MLQFTWKKNVAKMVAPDGLYWAKTSDGDYLIVDEDSGNDFGERKYVLTIDNEMNVKDAHLLAISGGKYSSRYEAGVSALGVLSRSRARLNFQVHGL